MAGLAVPFEVNTGQEDKRVAYTARGPLETLFVTAAGQLVHSFRGLPIGLKESSVGRTRGYEYGPGWALTETLIGSRPVLSAKAPSATRVSRFIGNDSRQWQAQIETVQRVSLGAAWPGIAVELVAHGNNVEKVFTVRPGADVRRIAIRLSGATNLELADDGALVAYTGNGTVSFTAPTAWQDIDGTRTRVDVAYALAGDRYGFLLGDHDPAYSVIIDPLLQATYLGGGSQDYANAIAVDASGAVFVAGQTWSSDFPGTVGGAQAVHGPGFQEYDVFVAKLNNSLTQLLQSTYLGGSDEDVANGIALDANGNVFVTGYTFSNNFPGTVGGAQGFKGGGRDGFVAKLNNGLTTLAQASYLGGSGDDAASSVAIDASGNVFVAGYSGSANFPHTSGGAQAVFGGGNVYVTDGFVAKLNNGLTAIIQASYLGGSSDDFASAIALDASGTVFVTGWTSSTNFPQTTGGAQPAKAGGFFADAFVATLNNSLTSLTQASYLGGSGDERARAIAVAGNGSVLVAGETSSTDFPGRIGGAQSVYGGVPYDGFVAKLNHGLTTLTQATYVGSCFEDHITAMALDSGGNVFVTGWTDSPDFPGSSGGAQDYHQGTEAFVAKLNSGLTSFIQSTYLGGTTDLGLATGISLDARGNVFVGGWTYSTDFPGTAGGAQANHANDEFAADAIVAKLTPSLALIDAAVAAVEVPLPPWLPLLLVLALAALGVRVLRRRR